MIYIVFKAKQLKNPKKPQKTLKDIQTFVFEMKKENEKKSTSLIKEPEEETGEETGEETEEDEEKKDADDWDMDY